MVEIKRIFRLFMGYSPEKAQDTEFQCKTIVLIAFVAAPTAVVFALINYYAEQYKLALLEIISIVLLLPCFTLISHQPRLPFVRNLLMLNACMLFMALFLYGGVGGSGITWSLMIPFLAFLITGLPTGWYWSLSYCGMMSALIYLQSLDYISLPYDETFLHFFPATFLFFSFIAAVLELQLERLHERHQHLLSKLEGLVSEKTKEFLAVNAKLKEEMKEHHKTIGDLKETEEQFLHAQRMESLGTLVAGIAHDFNNMLAGILGNIYLAKKKAGNNEDLLARLKNIETLSAHAADMIKQLLTFARKEPVKMFVFSFAPFFKEILKLAKNAIPESISLTYDITNQDLFIKGDSTQLQQLLMNLLNNARDAVEGVNDPTIHCQLEAFTPDNAFRSKYSALEAEAFVRLSVSDNGQGISQAVKEMVFEPFFTTKGAEKGTGLGLSMVFGAVERHQGKIELESEEGKGSTFIIYLPLQDIQTELTGGSQ